MMVGKRHFEAGPFRIGEALGERGVVIDPADAIALLQRDFGFGLALEGDEVRAVFLGHRLVVPGALDAADLLVLELLPGLQVAFLLASTLTPEA